MKKIPMFILWLVVLLVVASCDDNIPELLPHTIVKGRVLEYGTNEPVENAEVVLYERISTGAFSGTDIRVDTAITNAAGQYSFQYEDSGKFGLSASAETYFETNGIEYSNIRNKERNTRNIVLDPVAALELHIKNVNPFDENDLLTAYTNSIIGAAPENSYGTGIDFKVTQQVRGNRLRPMIWWVTKNGIYQEFRDSVYCQAHELTQYEIFY
jgi:hypothetical protein